MYLSYGVVFGGKGAHLVSAPFRSLFGAEIDRWSGLKTVYKRPEMLKKCV